MRLLVTGASGLIGRHVIAQAANDPGVEVVATSRKRPSDLPRQVEFRPADLTHADQATALVHNVAPSHIIHAAWETRHPVYWEDLSNLEWAKATMALAQAFGGVAGRRFVQLGSCAEYDWSHGLCIEGVTPDRPATRYGKSKLAAFRCVEAAGHERFEAVEARIFFVFGPGENSTRFIPLVCRSHLLGQIPSLGSGRQRRDLLHAEDAARAVLAVAATDGMTGIVNIGSGTPTSLAEAAILIAKAAGAKESGLGKRADRAADPDLLVPAIERLGSTGWKPKISLKEGLSRTYAWWRETLRSSLA